VYPSYLVNLSRFAEDIQSAGSDWVEAHGGKDSIRIMRYDSLTNSQQVLETRFAGYDAQGRAVFEGISPHGLSVFALAGLPIEAVPEPVLVDEPQDEPVTVDNVEMYHQAGADDSSGISYILWIIIGILAMLTVLIFVFYRKRKKARARN